MKYSDTTLHYGGLIRCCIQTIIDLAATDAECKDGDILDCKYEAAGNGNMILVGTEWRWNKREDKE